jgi:hypothetical protein
VSPAASCEILDEDVGVMKAIGFHDCDQTVWPGDSIGILWIFE